MHATSGFKFSELNKINRRSILTRLLLIDLNLSVVHSWHDHRIQKSVIFKIQRKKNGNRKKELITKLEIKKFVTNVFTFEMNSLYSFLWPCP